jgi:hypothetical protein
MHGDSASNAPVRCVLAECYRVGPDPGGSADPGRAESTAGRLDPDRPECNLPGAPNPAGAELPEAEHQEARPDAARSDAITGLSGRGSSPPWP